MNDDSNERAKIGGRMFADLSQAQVSFSMYELYSHDEQ